MPRSFPMALVYLITLVFSFALYAGEAVWIDVRTAEEFSQQHVAEATNIPYEEITDQINEVTQDKDKLIYVYCRSGRRSGIAKESLEGAGYTNVINVGGLQDALDKAAGPAEH